MSIGKPPNAGKGRPLGSKNRASQILRERLEGSGDDPVDVLLALMRHSSPKVQLQAAKALMPYVYPRLAATRVETSIAPELQSLRIEFVEAKDGRPIE